MNIRNFAAVLLLPFFLGACAMSSSNGTKTDVSSYGADFKEGVSTVVDVKQKMHNPTTDVVDNDLKVRTLTYDYIYSEATATVALLTSISADVMKQTWVFVFDLGGKLKKKEFSRVCLHKSTYSDFKQVECPSTTSASAK